MNKTMGITSASFNRAVLNSFLKYTESLYEGLNQ